MNFRNFNPNQPHGAIYWNGSNSALNALPFSLSGQPQLQPANGTNQFGLTLMEARQAVRDVAAVVNRWQDHFAACGVTPADIAALAGQIDRPFLRAQREKALR